MEPSEAEFLVELRFHRHFILSKPLNSKLAKSIHREERDLHLRFLRAAEAFGFIEAALVR